MTKTKANLSQADKLVSQAKSERWELLNRENFKKKGRKHAFDQEKSNIQEKQDPKI